MHNESLTVHECPKCEYTSTEAGRVRKHVKMVHEGERPYPCCLCEKAYANSSDLKRHQKTIHENQGKIIHQCYYCDLISGTICIRLAKKCQPPHEYVGKCS